jgi:uncharacterized phage-associated protein
MNPAFDEVKATQTAAAFLRLAGGSLQYLALIKLLYKADREALRRWGLPITTDRYASLKFGPVTSRIYDLIKASGSPSAHPTFWSRHISKAGQYNVSLSSDPGDSELSRAEHRLIAELYACDGAKDGFALAEETHRDFPEWTDPGDSSTPIEISDILEALRLSEDETLHAETMIAAQRAARDLAI